MRRFLALVLMATVLTGCGRNRPGDLPRPDPFGPLGQGTAPEVVDSLYLEAERLFRVGKWRQAQERLVRVTPVLLSTDPRYLRSRFYLAETHFGMREYLMASREFRRIADEHPDDELAPEALYRAGMAYRALWRRPQLDPTHGQTAMLVFAELAGRYPQSRAAARAQLVYQELEEWFAEKEMRNARYYLRWKAYESAILVLREIVATYPRTTVAPRALVAMVGAYASLGFEEDRQETCDYIRQYYPQAPDLDRTCPAPAPVPAASR